MQIFYSGMLRVLVGGWGLGGELVRMVRVRKEGVKECRKSGRP